MLPLEIGPLEIFTFFVMGVTALAVLIAFVVSQQVTQIRSQVGGNVVEVFVVPNTPLQKGDKLVQIDTSQYVIARDLAKANLKHSEATESKLKVELELAEENWKRDFGLYQKGSISVQKYEEAKRDLEVAKTSIAEAAAQIAVAQQQVKEAERQLKETTIVAPEAGKVVNLQLREGSGMAVAVGNPMMTFLPTTQKYMVAAIPSNFLRFVKPGQDVEVALKYFPGRILHGKVDTVIPITGEGQLSPSGQLPSAAKVIQSGDQFAVKIKLNEEYNDVELPVGAAGTVAIYTDTMHATHVFRKVTLRMESWLNFVF
jgi:RND family efflux transporter MFP subunit